MVFRPVLLQWLSITLQFFKFLHYVFLYIQTNLIMSSMQLFHISFTTMFFVTSAILRFFLCIFIGENFAQEVISHKKTFCIVSFANSVIQTNFIVSNVQFFHIIFYHNVYPSHVQFLRFFLCIFYRKILHTFYYFLFEFSQYGPNIWFTCAILS